MSFKSDLGPFRTALAERTFTSKYRHTGCESWYDLARVLVEDVCGAFLPKEERAELTQMISNMQFIPGGRYLYYAGRPKKYFNNCFLLKAEEDTREDWANLSWKAESCLLVGGGIGIDYTAYRGAGTTIKQTGGRASGPIPKMFMVNEIGRNVVQGGSRRSALYASINWGHPDANQFLSVKDWASRRVPGTEISFAQAKNSDFDFPAPLDMTNISLNYDTDFLLHFWKTNQLPDIFVKNIDMAMKNGEPGLSFNFFDKEKETLRNACTEVTSEDDSDACNLGSVNLSRIDDINQYSRIVELGTKFLVCGTLVADLPYPKMHEVRDKNRRLGLGLMGIHEWLLQRGQRYEITPELEKWLTVYKGVSESSGRELCNRLGISIPVAYRAIAPTGTIGMVAGTTTGIEPIYAVAYKRRYLVQGNNRKYQFAVDYIAQQLIDRYGLDPESIETAADLAADPERRISFQAKVQDYVDQAISSTVNIPAYDPDKVLPTAAVVCKYMHRLRGLTFYPDGARGGQPITKVPYSEAKTKLGLEFEEHLETNDACKGGICGI